MSQEESKAYFEAPSSTFDGAVCDLVQDGSNGYLLNTAGLNEEEQAKEYRARLQHLVHDTASRHTMGEAGLVEASLHTWSAAMKMLLDGYEEIIAA